MVRKPKSMSSTGKTTVQRSPTSSRDAVIRTRNLLFTVSVVVGHLLAGAGFPRVPSGFIHDVAGTSIFTTTVLRATRVAFLRNPDRLMNTPQSHQRLSITKWGRSALPVECAVDDEVLTVQLAPQSQTAKADWDCSETSWGSQEPTDRGVGAGAIQARHLDQGFL